MGRPIAGEGKKKIKTSITIDPDLFCWVQEKIKSKEFASFTHAVERGLFLLKDNFDN